MNVAVVLGASGAIGYSLSVALLESSSDVQVICSYRNENKASKLKELARIFDTRITLVRLDSGNEDDFKNIFDSVAKNINSLNLTHFFNCIGLLDTKENSAEKSLQDFNKDFFLKNMESNCLSTLFFCKQNKDLIRNSNKPIIASISAKVGSIEDNRLGGWYSYRMSKAALNMGIKTLSKEVAWWNKEAIVLAIHPGTTESKLSEAYMDLARKRYKIHQPNETARNILQLLDNDLDTGGFYSWDGTSIPW